MGGWGALPRPPRLGLLILHTARPYRMSAPQKARTATPEKGNPPRMTADQPKTVTHWIDVAGKTTVRDHLIAGNRVIVNELLITCPQCGAENGLQLRLFAEHPSVWAGCPNQHVWEEHRYPAEDFRQAAQRAAAAGHHG